MVEQTRRPTVLLFDVNETLLDLTPVQMSMHLVPAKIALVVYAVIGASIAERLRHVFHAFDHDGRLVAARAVGLDSQDVSRGGGRLKTLPV